MKSLVYCSILACALTFGLNSFACHHDKVASNDAVACDCKNCEAKGKKDGHACGCDKKDGKACEHKDPAKKS